MKPESSSPSRFERWVAIVVALSASLLVLGLVVQRTGIVPKGKRIAVIVLGVAQLLLGLYVVGTVVIGWRKSSTQSSLLDWSEEP